MEQGASHILNALSLASLDDTLPVCDLHGFPCDALVWEVDLAIVRARASFLRIVFGYGSGALRNAVFAYLQESMKKNDPLVLGFFEESRGASCVVALR